MQQGDEKLVSKLDEFIKRDGDDTANAYGQHVTDAFHQADFFVDNTPEDEADDLGLLHDPLARLVSIIAHDKVVRPTIEETAMHHAHSARVRSACLSRQVGAALVDRDGTIVSTGTNEVPRAGGGAYGEHFATDIHAPDDRCAFRGTVYCSSNREQNEIVDDLIAGLPELAASEHHHTLRHRILKTRLGGLIEFSRAVHAEMDALLSAGREGKSTVGTRLSQPTVVRSVA
jgi:deoxycytidylate deaminase